MKRVEPEGTDHAEKRRIVIRQHSSDGSLERSDVIGFEMVFQNLLDVYFYVKNVSGRWISCNAASLQLLNFSRSNEVIGKWEADFFPPQIAKAIRKDDEKILENGESVLNRIEVIPDQRGELIWVQTNKLPIFAADGSIDGLIGITRPVSSGQALPQEFELFRHTVLFIRENLSETITVSQLAAAAKLSESQFRRKFRAEFGSTPQEFILHARLQAASHSLRSSSKPIASIASDCGFTDQSYFTRQFKRLFEETPLGYRRRWQSSGS